MTNFCTMYTKTKTMNARKNPWLRSPTQLLIHWQWWSKRSTHWLQNTQCQLRSVATTLHDGQRLSLSNILIISSNELCGSCELRKLPGSLHPANRTAMETRSSNPPLMYTQKILLRSYTNNSSSAISPVRRRNKSTACSLLHRGLLSGMRIERHEHSQRCLRSIATTDYLISLPLGNSFA